MDKRASQILLDLNRKFYNQFGPAFAATRRRIQPGVRRVMDIIPAAGRWLDLGCGSGALALQWAETVDSGLYLGLDFSPTLLGEARSLIERIRLPDGLEIRFAEADLSNPDWVQAAEADAPFDGALAFAVLHHLPGSDLRLRVMQAVRGLLPAGAHFVHSVWQFDQSPRLMERVQSWEQIRLRDFEVDPGDTLLDWRAALPGQPAQVGLRYVHLFTRAELAKLAADAGFAIEGEYQSDGEGGKLGLYQFWRAI